MIWILGLALGIVAGLILCAIVWTSDAPGPEPSGNVVRGRTLARRFEVVPRPYVSFEVYDRVDGQLLATYQGERDAYELAAALEAEVGEAASRLEEQVA